MELDDSKGKTRSFSFFFFLFFFFLFSFFFFFFFFLAWWIFTDTFPNPVGMVKSKDFERLGIVKVEAHLSF